MGAVPELVYAAAKRHVCAFDRETGQEIWRTKLPHMLGEHATLMVSGDDLFVGRRGHVFRLDRWTGEVLWQAELAKGGLALPSMAMAGVRSDELLLKACEAGSRAAAGAGGGGGGV